MAINVSVQYNGGLLPDIILLTQCNYHRETRLNAMKRFSLCSLRSHPNVLTFPPLTGGCSEGLHAFIFLFFIVSRSTPVAQLAPRNLLTRWDVSSIPANGIFLTKN